MRKFHRQAASLAALFATLMTVPLAHAVSLSPRGTGQVLIYPYYTVNSGQSTLLSLVNTTDRAKALKVHMREARNGREVLGFNLYLAPYDVWTGALFARDEAGPANLLTDDGSCAVPDLRGATLPTLGDGRRYVPFQNASYSGNNADTGPTDLARTREGEIDVIEMGELGGMWATHATARQGAPRNCDALVQAWAANGAWTIQPNDVDLGAPHGGLYGSLAIVNVAQGTFFQVAATALDGFSAYAQHTEPGAAHPDLGDARSSAAGVQPPYADADVEVEGTTLHAHYVGADRTVDAVSVVLSSNVLFNEYSVNRDDGSNTDWVLTMPTKRHYVDRSLLPDGSNALPPYREAFGETVAGASCVGTGEYVRDREAYVVGSLPSGAVGFTGYEQYYLVLLCGQANVVSLLPGVEPDFHGPPHDVVHVPSAVLASTLSHNMPMPGSGAGVMELFPYGLDPRVDANGMSLGDGLPVVGFAVVKYVNANVTPGVMANYSAAIPHRSWVVCHSPECW